MDSLFLPIARPGLFRSRAWLRAWLKAWGDYPDIDFPREYLSRDGDAPALLQSELESLFFKVNEPLLTFLSVLSVYPAGVSCRSTASIRSEYFQLSADPQANPSVAADYFQHILAEKWDRLILPDILLASSDYSGIVAQARAQKLSVIKTGYESTYGVNLARSTFPDYIKGLGKNSRLKLFNSRKKLEHYGEVKVENIWPNREGFFALLNSFHERRWGKPCYRDRNEIFINTLLDELPGIGGEVDFSVMTVNAVPVSVAFDIAIDGRIYNVQSGYAEDFAKGLALGTLHLGYQIEAAFSRNTSGYYDFMAGRGKNSNYKKALSNSSAEFVTLTLVRNPLLSCAYKVKACLKGMMFFLSKFTTFR